MAAIDKRTIVASKRARNKRKKAMRTNAKALAAAANARPECDSDSGLATPTTSSEDESPLVRPLAMPIVEVLSMGNHCSVIVAATALAVQLASDETNNQHDSDVDENDEEDEVEDDDELVFVCRPTMQDFCTRFVAPADEFAVHTKSIANNSKTPDYRQFTVRIPSFRETKEGFTTYTISVTICTMDSRQSFQVERRYSEFVSFANDLEQYLQSSAFQELRESRKEQDIPLENKNPQHVENITSDTRFQWELPPKTWFRMTQVTALEERRSKLETSLLALLAYEPSVICHVPLVRDFLMLDLFGAQVVEEKCQQHV